MSDNINQDIAISGEGNIVVGKGDVIINPLPPAETRLRHDLGILLKNVETTWVKGVLEKSLHEAALIELGLEFRNDAIDNPWRMVLEGPDQTRQTLPRGRKIKAIFDEANRLLLILGEPGSGKTTTLLQLARELIAEVDQAFTQPIPVIFNLSTWTNKQQPLDEWLFAELNGKYRLPKKDGRRWLEERRILPLLDGLDEVKAENRGACVEKINQLVNNYGLQGIVVCSRFKDYSDLPVRLAFYRAIYLQPLTTEQVDEYLNQAGDKLASLRGVLQRDEAVRSMAQSPLILNIMSLAYQNTSAADLGDPTLDTNRARRQHLFATYITRMFNRKGNKRPYRDEQTKQRLSWLARNMQEHNQEIFLIEGLQPSWLQTHALQWGYFLTSRAVSGLLLGLGFGTSIPRLYTLFREVWEYVGLSTKSGLIVGSFVGFIDVLWFEWLYKWAAREKSTFWSPVIRFIVVGLVGSLIFASQAGQLEQYLYPWVFGGLLIGLFLGRGQSRESDIETVETLRWSWTKAIKGGLFGGSVTLLIAVLFWLGYWQEQKDHLAAWIWQLRNDGKLEMAQQLEKLSHPFVNWDTLKYWLRMVNMDFVARFGGQWMIRDLGMLLGLAGMTLNGLRREIIETKSVPNQGVQLSIKNALLGGLLFGLLGALFLRLSLQNWFEPRAIKLTDNLYGPHFMLIIWLLFGLGFGLLGSLWYGGLDIIQHYILRLFLVIQGHTPANYSHFLDYAVDQIFLQKVGGGYRFIHRLLLEHFAEMNQLEAMPPQGK